MHSASPAPIGDLLSAFSIFGGIKTSIYHICGLLFFIYLFFYMFLLAYSLTGIHTVTSWFIGQGSTTEPHRLGARYFLMWSYTLVLPLPCRGPHESPERLNGEGPPWALFPFLLCL